MTTTMTGEEDNNTTGSDTLRDSGSLQGSWAPPKSARERQYESAYKRALGDTLTWIERSTGIRFVCKPPPDAAYPPGLFRQLLSDGVQLCELLNALRPGCVKKINRAKNRIAGLDNLALFIQTCDQMFSVPKLSMFEVSDVIEDLSEKYSPEDAVYEDERRCKKILTCLLRLHRFVDLRPSTPRLELSALMAVLGGGSGGSRPSSAGSKDSTAASADPPSVQLSQPSAARVPAIANSVNPLQFVRPDGNELVASARNQLRVIQRNKEQLAEAAAAAAAANTAASRGDRKTDSEGDAWISSLNCWKERRRQTLQNSGALQRLGLLEEQVAAETHRETQQAMEAARSRNRSIGQALKERARSLGHLDSEDFEEEPPEPTPKAVSPAPDDSKSIEAENSLPKQNRFAPLYERQTSQPAPARSPSPPVRNIPAAFFDRSRNSPPQSPKRHSPTAASFDLRRSPPQSPKLTNPTAASFDLRRSPPTSPKRHSPLAASFELRKSPSQSPNRRSPSVLDRPASPPMPTPQAEQLSVSSSGGRFLEEFRVASGISLGFRDSSVSTAKSPTPEASSSSPLLSQTPRSGPLPWERRQEFRPVSSKFNAAIAATSPRSRYADVSASTPSHSRLTTSTSLTTDEERLPNLSQSATSLSPQTQQLLRQSMPDTSASAATAGKDPFKNLTNGGGVSSQKPLQPPSTQKLLQNQTIMEQHEGHRATRMARRDEAQLKHRSQSSDGGDRGLAEPALPPNTGAKPDVSLRRQQAPPPPPLPPRTSASSGNLQLAGATGERERPLSVSGKKRCSHCHLELGSGGAMAIESLSLYYHIKCFRCCVCQTLLGNGTTGADVRVRRDRLHCPGCFSSDEGIMGSVLGVV